jgi:hypothetical protein
MCVVCLQASAQSTDNFDASIMKQPIRFTPPDMAVLGNCGADDGFTSFSYVNANYAPTVV